MGWTVYQSLIALLMVVTGSINTISTKWADITESEGRNGTKHKFEHPFVQAAGMFLGEMSCLLVFSIVLLYYKLKLKKVRKIQRSNNLDLDSDNPDLPDLVKVEKFNIFLFFIPALLDMGATTTMYIGLTMTTSSSFQMLRGALIVFTGFLSITLLKRKLKTFQWLGIFIIIIGLATVGSNDFLKKSDGESKEASLMITGDILIILAQILTAFQMISEEKFLTGKTIPPLLAVGLEGFFGFLIACLLIIPLTLIPKSDGTFIEDTYDAYLQIIHNPIIAIAIGGNIVSIAFFNFAGISVTKEISATTRTVLDSVRTLVVWLFGLAVSWETYSTLQLFGFILLVCGIMTHNDVIFRPYLIKKGYIVDDADRYNIVGNGGSQQESTIEDEENLNS